MISRMVKGRRQRYRIGHLANIRRELGAWTVTVMRQGRRFVDYFPDRVWGGRERALVAAQRFRDGLLMHVEPDTRVRRRTPEGSLNLTGVVGVSFEEYEVDGRDYERFVAHWPDPDKGKQRRRFGVGRYGMKRALALAVAARAAGVARVRAEALARQRAEAGARLDEAPPLPARVKDPLSRKGINMGRRRPRRSSR